jgi:hypothetical protein
MKTTLATMKALGCLAITLTAFGLGGGVTPAAAQTDWQAQSAAVAPDGTSRILWTADTPTGTVAGVWKMDATGNKVGSGPVYGPYTDINGQPWEPTELVIAHDGTSRLSWVSHGSAGQQSVIWTLDANGNATSTGTVYGPYSDSNGKWVPQQIAVAADGTVRQVWVNSGTVGVEAGIWTLNSAGKQTSVGPTYGPYYDSSGSNWEPLELEIAPDNTQRLLWITVGTGNRGSAGYGGDSVILWKLDTNGTRTGNGPAYGPYSGWGVADFDIDTSDSSLRMLWKQYGTTDSNDENYTGDVAGLWSLDTNGSQTKVGLTYGPYIGWSAQGVIALSDGTSRVIWDNTSSMYDEIGLWGFDSSDKESFEGTVYGPYTGWTLDDTEFNRSDNTFRLLWTRDDDAAGMWSANISGQQTSVGPTYGPYTYGN